MSSKNSSIRTSSPSTRGAPKRIWSIKPSRSPKKCSTLQTSWPLPPPQLPPPGSPPPPRPPRPKTSLPNLRPTVILSPLAIPQSCAFRLLSTDYSARSNRFSDEVFTALLEHQKLTPTTPQSMDLANSHPYHVAESTCSLSLPRNMGTGLERFGFSAVVQLFPSRLTRGSQSQGMERNKSIRATDGFECAMLLGRRPDTPTRIDLVVTQIPTSPARAIWQADASFSPSIKLESNAVDPELGCDETAVRATPFQRHRRLFYILATVFFVLVTAAAIAGSVIWKLTAYESPPYLP